jgi:hypothetical protein
VTVDLDRALRRIARNAVVGGAALTIFSFLLLKRGTARMMQPSPDVPDGGISRGRAALLVLARYALLGFAAYVMIARLRLHPLGLLVGASSIVAAVTVETVLALSGQTSGRAPR